MSEEEIRVLATLCSPCCNNCPTVIEAADGENIVVVGKTGDPALSADAVKKYVGDGEAAVVIPKSLLLEALKTVS